MLHILSILTCNIELILERGFPGGSVENNLRAMQEMGEFNAGSGKIPGETEWQPTQDSCL